MELCDICEILGEMLKTQTICDALNLITREA